MNKDQKREYMRKYYQDHKEQLRQYNEEYLEKHPDYKKQYYQKNKEAIYQNQREWQKKNKKQFIKLCGESRKRRADKLRSQGCTNPWAVINYNAEPKYK